MTQTLNTKMLRDAMYELGLTTYELARQSGVPQLTVLRILFGQNRSTPATLRAICGVLDLESEQVIVKSEKLETAA